VAYFKLFKPFITDFGEATLRSTWLPLFFGADLPDPGHPGKTRHDSILKEYFPAGGADGASLGSLLSDYQPAVGINNCLGLWTSDAFLPWMPAIYQSEFADPDAPVLGVGIAKGMDPGFALGAVHSSELNSYFPNLSNTSAIDGPDLKPASQALADRMVAYWGAFVATGSPAASGLPEWPRYAGGGTGVLLLVPGAVAPYDASTRHRCAFWRGLYP
jgi:para-nitrobenzyl esterase